MKYQDTWINGQLIEKGIRSCSPRYDVIKQFCDNKLGRNFTVCDIGANMCYFGIRLIEDFNAKVFAFEFNQYKERNKIVTKNKTKNLMYINRRLKLNDLYMFDGIVKFDLILGLSVLHHVSEPINLWVDAMIKISKFTIIELAGKDSKRFKQYQTIDNTELLGYGDSHLVDGFKREILLIKNQKV